MSTPFALAVKAVTTLGTLRALVNSLLEALKAHLRHVCSLQSLLDSDLWIIPFGEGKKCLHYMLGLTLSDYRDMLLIIYYHENTGKHPWKPLFATKEKGSDKPVMKSAELDKLAISLGLNLVDKIKYDGQWFWCVNNIDTETKKLVTRKQVHNPYYDSASENPFQDTNMSDEDYEKFMSAVIGSGTSVVLKSLLDTAKTFLSPCLQHVSNNHVKAQQQQSALANDESNSSVTLKRINENILVLPNASNGSQTVYCRIPGTVWKGSVPETSHNFLNNWNQDLMRDFFSALIKDAEAGNIDKETETKAADMIEHMLKVRYPSVTRLNERKEVSVEQLLALQRLCHLSDNGVNVLRRFLREKLGYIMLPGKDRVNNFRDSQDLPTITFPKLVVNGRSYDSTFVSPMEALHHLIKKYQALNECVLGGGVSFGVNLQIDKGGGSTKLIMLLGSPCVEGQHFPTIIGKYTGPDDYDTLSVFAERYNESLLEIQSLGLLHIAMGNKWEYVLLPLETFPISATVPTPATASTTAAPVRAAASATAAAPAAAASATATTGTSATTTATATATANATATASTAAAAAASAATATATATGSNTASGRLPDGLKIVRKNDKVVLIDAENGNELKTLPWTMDEIESGLTYTYVPMKLFLSSDCQCHCTLLGIVHAETHYCFYCLSRNKDNQNVHHEVPNVTIADLMKKVGLEIFDGSKISHRRPLFWMIEVENRIVSLHLRLGIASYAYKMLLDEVLKIERMQVLEIREAYIRKHELLSEVKTCRLAYHAAQSEVDALKVGKSKDDTTFKEYSAAVRMLERCTSVHAECSAIMTNLQQNKQRKLENTKSARIRTSMSTNDLAAEEEHHKNAANDLQIATQNVARLRARVLACNLPTFIVENSRELCLTQDEMTSYDTAAGELSSAEAALQTSLREYRDKNQSYFKAETELDTVMASHAVSKKDELTQLQLEVQAILIQFSIKSAIWFGGITTLQGKNSLNLLMRAMEYIPCVLEACKRAFNAHMPQNDASAKVWDVFVEFTNKFIRTVTAAHRVFQKTEGIQQITVEGMAQLEKDLQTFSEGWRSLGFSKTPKFHCTEKHLLSMAKSCGYLGLMSEAVVERMHYLCNLYYPQTHNKGNFEDNETSLYRYLELQSNPAVSLEVFKLSGKRVRDGNAGIDSDGGGEGRVKIQNFQYTNLDDLTYCQLSGIGNYMKATVPKEEIHEM